MRQPQRLLLQTTANWVQPSPNYFSLQATPNVVLHMPSFSVVRYEQPPFIGLYTRTLEKHGHKMKSYVAVQKKLLVLIYAIWKSNKPYQVNYEKNRHTGEKEQEPSSLHGLAQAGIENESSAKPEGGATQGRHTVETSQCASSLQLQIYH